MTDYYVHYGVANGDGSIGSPWSKLYHAESSLAAGDTVNVRSRDDGHYEKDYLDSSASGADGQPITIKCWDEGQRFKITGSDIATSFTHLRDEIWYVPTSISAGAAGAKACTTFVGNAVGEGNETFLACIGNDIDEGSLTLNRGEYSHNGTTDRLYFSPAGGDITGLSFRHQSNQGTITNRLGADYWVVQDAEMFVTQTAAINPQGSYSTISNCYVSRSSTTAYRLGAQNNTGTVNNSIINCTAEHNLNAVRIFGQSSGATVRGCTLRNTGLPEDGYRYGDRSTLGAGLLNGTSDFATNTTIEDCLLENGSKLSGDESDAGNEYPDPGMIIIQTDGLTIKNTIIKDSCRTGMMLGIRSSNIVVENCIIHGANLVFTQWDPLSDTYDWQHTNQRGGISINKSGGVTLRYCDVYNNLSGRYVYHTPSDTEARGGALDIRDTSGQNPEVPNRNARVDHCRFYASHDAAEPVGTYDYVKSESTAFDFTVTFNPPEEEQVGVSRSPQLAVLAVNPTLSADNEIVDGQDDVSIYVRHAGDTAGTVAWGPTQQPIKSWSDHHIVIGPIDATGVNAGESASLVVTKA